MRRLLPLLQAAAPAAAWAQPAAPARAVDNAPGPVIVDSYSRVRWGSFWDFMDIYREHHAPVLAEMRRLSRWRCGDGIGPGL